MRRSPPARRRAAGWPTRSPRAPTVRPAAWPADRARAAAGARARRRSAASVAREQEPATDRRRASDAWQRTGIGEHGQQPGAAEILRQSERDARSAGDQRMPRRRFADGEQMRVGHRIDDRPAPPLLPSAPSSPCGSPRRPARRWRRAPARPAATSAVPARAPGWRRSSASADASPCRSRSAARNRRTGSPGRRCGHWWGRRGRRARSRSPALRSAHRRPGRYCRCRWSRRSSST